MRKINKKILLLSTIPPCSNYSGGQVLEQLCQFLPKNSLVCFILLDKSLHPEISKELSWMPMEYFSKPADGWPKLPLYITPILSFFGEMYHSLFTTRILAKKVIAYGKKHQVDCLWVTLQGQTTIRLARKVAQGLGVPLLTEVWDDPEWWLKDNHIDKISSKLILKNFTKDLKFSEKCATAGWAMANVYQKEYSAKTVPFLPSLKENWALKPATKIHSEKELIIGVVGQLYSVEEWQKLIVALDKTSWKIGKREVKIRILASCANLYSYKPARIEFLGYHSQKDTVNLISHADILYCPYIFNPEFKKVSELSFPGKLITYLASGRPVFFHGPVYAGPGGFLKKNKAGFVCNSLDPEIIIRDLKELINNKKLYAQLADNGHKMFKKYFTFACLRQSFADFLDIESHQLRRIL